jgi:sec-independent protein translocase protein TatB
VFIKFKGVMKMFGLGMPEILLILALALIIIGPKKLPDLAKTLGKSMREFKGAAQDFKNSINIESSIADIEPPAEEIQKNIKKANEELADIEKDTNNKASENSDSDDTDADDASSDSKDSDTDILKDADFDTEKTPDAQDKDVDGSSDGKPEEKSEKDPGEGSKSK